MLTWKRAGRSAKDDHLTHCTDFIRVHLTQTCRPVDLIQTYACRLSERGARSERLKDPPKYVADILTSGLIVQKQGVRQAFPPTTCRQGAAKTSCPEEPLIPELNADVISTLATKRNSQSIIETFLPSGKVMEEVR
ncbi:hypothetical protein Y032_0021g363 [Ancylostoma ceylanicum]|nr:hypothetical protein Y032_0021g363 [Ancylostoma ceylanicum]